MSGPWQIESPAQGLAMIAVKTYGEWLPSDARLVGGRWDWKGQGFTWLRNIPTGPSAEGVAAVEAAIAEYGEYNVLTGNAAHPDHRGPHPTLAPVEYAPGQVGLYVRGAS